jgi:hypothetical protein
MTTLFDVLPPPWRAALRSEGWVCSAFIRSSPAPASAESFFGEPRDQAGPDIIAAQGNTTPLPLTVTQNYDLQIARQHHLSPRKLRLPGRGTFESKYLVSVAVADSST